MIDRACPWLTAHFLEYEYLSFELLVCAYINLPTSGLSSLCLFFDHSFSSFSSSRHPSFVHCSSWSPSFASTISSCRFQTATTLTSGCRLTIRTSLPFSLLQSSSASCRASCSPRHTDTSRLRRRRGMALQFASLWAVSCYSS